MTWKSIGLFLFPCQISVQSLMSTYSWEGLNLAIKLKKWTCIHTYICTEAMLYLPSNKLREGIKNLYYVLKGKIKKIVRNFIIWYYLFFHAWLQGFCLCVWEIQVHFLLLSMASSWYVWVKKKPRIVRLWLR